MSKSLIDSGLGLMNGYVFGAEDAALEKLIAKPDLYKDMIRVLISKPDLSEDIKAQLKLVEKDLDNNKKKEALKLLYLTIGWLAAFTAVILAIAVLVR